MMAYRSTPATQSTDFSPFFLLYGREMRLPIDTLLQPKDHLNQDCKIHLGRILQNLEVCRKLAGENIKAAQDKYKYQHDKRSQLPSFQPAQRVWLYCTKVPPGKAPKLHRKWVGPYYITMIGPNHTFRLRNAQTNLEVKSLVNAARLKPYYDPNDRPTNPPDNLPDPDAELDPEEIVLPDMPPENQSQQADNNPAQPGQSSNDPAQPRHSKQTKQKRQVPHKQGPQSNKSKQTKAPAEPNLDQKSPTSQSQPQTMGSKPTSPHTQASKTKSGKAPMEPKLDQRNKHVHPKQHVSKPAVPNAQAKTNKSSKPKQTKSNEGYNNKQQNTTQPHANNTPSATVEKPNARNQPASSKTNKQQTQSQDNSNKTPACQDCLNNSCKAFSETDIKSILSSNRSNGAMYYRLKFHDNSTNWFFPCKVPSHLIREFHTKRTMSGKKRKKPLKQNQHKFFTESQPNVNVIGKKETSEESSTEPVLVGVKIVDGRSYYLVKSGKYKQWQSITTAHKFASGIIHKIQAETEDYLYRMTVEHAKNSNKPVEKFPKLDGLTTKHIHEMELREDGHWYCLVNYMKPEIAPTWENLNGLPQGTTDNFRGFLTWEYDKYVDDRF